MANKIRSYRTGNEDDPIHYIFGCTACNCEHRFDKRWEFNQDFEKPTITPSYLRRGFLGFNNELGYDSQEKVYGTCHSFIKDGMIEYLSDCTHKLAGQTVELLDITE